MAMETHAIILAQGEDLLTVLHRNLKSGDLVTSLTEETFPVVEIRDLKYVRIADPHETSHHGHGSIWVEVTITF